MLIAHRKEAWVWLPGRTKRRLIEDVAPLVLVVASFLIGAHLCAQQFNFSAYGEGSGLSNLNATALLQDYSGIVWAGTQSGVFTADGDRFRKQSAFTEAGFESIRAMRQDAAGRLWVADGRHIGYWRNGELHTLEGMNFRVLSHEVLDLVNLPGQRNGIYFLRAGELSLISSPDGGQSWKIAAAFSDKFLSSHPELKAIDGITPGTNSSLWLGCGQSLCNVDLAHESFERFGQAEGVPADKWRALLMTRSGNLWARGEKNVLTRSISSIRFEAVKNLPSECFNNIRQALLSEDPAGDVLLNLSSGIAIGSKKGWHVFGESNGLPEDETDTLMFDRSGALWLTSLGHGILRWRGYGDWEGWNRTSGLHNNIVWSLGRDSVGGIWISTELGLDKLDRFSNHVSAEGSLRQRLMSVVVDPRHHVWTVDPAGKIFDLDPKSGVTRVAAADLERIFQMRIDSQQRIWACTRKGLVFFSRDDGWALPHLVQDGAGPQGYAWSIAEGRDGALWVSTGKGLFRLVGSRWSEIHLPFAAGIEYNRMIAPGADGTIWMQSKLPFPIIHLKIQGDAATLLSQVSGTMITSDNTTFLETDQRGWLWVGSDDGLRVFNGFRWVLCTAEDGLIWNDTDFHAFLADSDGSVWIGTSAGVSHLIHPEHLFGHVLPQVQLADVLISGLLIPRGAPKYDLRRPTLSFRFLNLNYDRGSGVVAQYSLEGEENDWQQTDGELVRFPALNAGSYTLHVRAYDQRRHLSSDEIKIPFIVLDPWWRRRWFITIEVLSGLLLILGLWRLSIHLLVARQQQLERLVAVRTAELEREKVELLDTRSALLEITRRDALTGLLNRTAVFERLSKLCDVTRASGSPVAIIMADLDSFKRVNDDYGHLIGDAVLRECAVRINGVTRPVDAVGRYGGEELLIIMPGLSVGCIKPRIEQIRLAIGATPISCGKVTIAVTCSFGVTWFFGEDMTIENLIGAADAALYQAKKNGRNRIEYAELALA